MKFGAQVGVYATKWDDLLRVIKICDSGRWNSVWFADHYLPPARPESVSAYEGISVAAAAAAVSNNVQIGHMVLGNTYRNPALAAKMAATIDQISHGRFTLAIGAAWFQREHEAYGFNFPPMRERQDRLQEACKLIRELFHSTKPVNHKGDYYCLDEAPLSPGAYGDPIPIMVGGTGPMRTLKTLAMYGDVFNLDGWAGGPMTKSYLDSKWAVLERHCEAVGRDPTDIRKTVLVPSLISDDKDECSAMINARRLGEGSAIGSKNYVIDRLGEMIDAGVDEIMIGGLNSHTPESYEQYEHDVLSSFSVD